MEKHKLPHSQSALILGIFSIVTSCCCSGLPGIILGFFGMNEAKKAKQVYDQNPEMYSGIGNADTGRITSIIGIVLGIILAIWTIYIISTGQWSEMIEEFQRGFQESQQQ